MDIECDIKTEAKSSPEANDLSEKPLRLVVSPQASSKHSNEDESQPSGTQPSPSSSSSPSNSALDSFIQIFQQQMSGSAKTSPSAEPDLTSKPQSQPQAPDPRDMLFRLGQQLMLLASNPTDRSTVSPEVASPNNLKGLSMRGNQKYSAFYQQKKLGMPFTGNFMSNPVRPGPVSSNSSPVLKKLPQKRPLEDHPDFNKLTTTHNKPKETAFLCSCNEEFENLYIFTIHMKDTGHKPKSTPSDRDIPKLVRGQDMWINSETEQTREILRCMHCQQSFRTLPDLTMHMIATNHFSEIVYNEINSKNSTSDPEKRRGEAIKRRCVSQTQKQSPHNESSDSAKDDASSKGSDLCAPDSTTTESLEHAQKVKIDSPLDSKTLPRLPEEEDKESKENPLSSLQKLVEFQQKSKPSQLDQNSQDSDGLMNAVLKIFSHLSSEAVDDKNEAIHSLKRLIEQEKMRSSQDCGGDNSMVNMLNGFLNFVNSKDTQESKKSSPRGSPSQVKVQTPTKTSQPSRPNFSTIPSNSQSSHIMSSGITKKAKCHFCGKPFANKGQVRLHISKNKCPCLMQQQSSLGNFGAMNGFGSDKSGSSPKDLDNVSKLGNPHLNAALELMKKQFNEPSSPEVKPKKEESIVSNAFMGTEANSQALKSRLNMMTLFSQALGLNAGATIPVPVASSSSNMVSNPLLGNFTNLFPLLNGVSMPTAQSNSETANASKLEKYLSLAKQLAVAQMFSSPELNFGVGK